jgi:hypothetical protein
MWSARKQKHAQKTHKTHAQRHTHAKAVREKSGARHNLSAAAASASVDAAVCERPEEMREHLHQERR